MMKWLNKLSTGNIIALCTLVVTIIGVSFAFYQNERSNLHQTEKEITQITHGNDSPAINTKNGNVNIVK